MNPSPLTTCGFFLVSFKWQKRRGWGRGGWDLKQLQGIEAKRWQKKKEKKRRKKRGANLEGGLIKSGANWRVAIDQRRPRRRLTFTMAFPYYSMTVPDIASRKPAPLSSVITSSHGPSVADQIYRRGRLLLRGLLNDERRFARATCLRRCFVDISFL